MDLDLRGKTAVITGGSRGIGRAIARSLVAEGCRVALCARGEETLEEARRELAELAGEEAVLTLALDVTEAGAEERMMVAAEERFGGVDIFIGNAGASRHKPIEEATEEDWDFIVDLNLRSQARWGRAAIPRLRRRGGGAILYVASVWGRESGGPGRGLYVSTKAALIGLAKTMGLELASEGIRVLTVAPGSILFPGGGWDRRQKKDPEGIARFVEEEMPLGRFGRLEEVADVVTFLVSPRASLVTAASISVDGGQARSLI